jgi:hypothetical protein
MRVPVTARLIPIADRESILGDLFEEADVRELAGTRRHVWLARECGSIALGLSFERARGWFVLPPVREIVSGLAIDGRGVLRGGHPVAAIGRGVLFCGAVATLALGVEVLVGTLLRASGL